MHATSIMTPGHQAYKVFTDDVNSTYPRIKTRTAEIAAERAANPSAHEGAVEQIQLQAVEPGSEIHINVPQPKSTDPVEQQARAVFETFPPGLQRALESNTLDRVNDVLGKMSIEEAEAVVGQMGEHGMLDMRQGVIDSTTDEGKEEIRQMHEDAHNEGAEDVRMDARVHIPVADSEDLEEQKDRAAFEELPEDLRYALEKGTVNDLTEALKKRDREEVEGLLAKMGEHGILDLRQPASSGEGEIPGADQGAAEGTAQKVGELDIADVD